MFSTTHNNKSLIMKIFKIGTSIIVSVAFLTACGLFPNSKNQLVLYNGQHLQTTQALVNKFEQITGISVVIRNGDEDTLVNQIEQEGSQSPADLIFTENSPALVQLSDQNVLYSLPESIYNNSNSKFDPANKQWIAVTLRYSEMVYNTKLIHSNQLPNSILSLANKRFYNKIGLAPTETDFQPILTSLIKAYGYSAALKWLLGVKHNAGSHIYPDNESLTSAVNSGQVTLAVINQYYWYRLRSQIGKKAMNSALKPFRAKNPGNVVDVSGVGILRSSSHKTLALEFIKFVASKVGQDIIEASDSYEYPANVRATANSQLPSFKSYHPYPISIEELGNGSAAVRLLKQAQLI